MRRSWPRLIAVKLREKIHKIPRPPLEAGEEGLYHFLLSFVTMGQGPIYAIEQIICIIQLKNAADYCFELKNSN
ncbi:MAG: hypothetical protein BGO44_08605 [Legionella sp. 39-23]|nr:MAG: hypothetical protein BGO44_08605 [Legionella sp. 39-23]